MADYVLSVFLLMPQQVIVFECEFLAKEEEI
jgi:hypothetical protein